MARAMGLLAGLLAAMASAMIACAGDPSNPAPADRATPTAVTAAPQSNQIATAAIQPTPAATVQPVPATAVAATPPPATSPPPAANTPRRPASTPPPVSPPTETHSQAAAPERFLIRLKDDLDDPLGYCIDVRGFGAGIRLDADLQAHSCKSNSPDDQSFAMMEDPQLGTIVLVDYDVCLAVADPEPGASILLRPCDDPSSNTGFEFLADGRLHLLLVWEVSQPQLCIAVAGGPGEPAGGRNHLRRDLFLTRCGEADPVLISWELVKP